MTGHIEGIVAGGLSYGQGRVNGKRPSETKPEPAPRWPEMSGSVSGYLNNPPPELHWLMSNRLLADRGHLLTGIGGSSKTRTLYHLAIAAIIGRTPWGWKANRTGSAALFLAEDTAENVHRTLAAIVAHSDMTAAEIKLIGERLRVYPLAGKSAKLLCMIQGIGLSETSHVRDLMDTCREIPDLSFIGLDPALALTDGDEANPSHQRRLGELVDRIAIQLSACVVLASHAAKALQSAEEVGSHTSRGSGAITDALRAEYVLRTMTAPEAKKFGINDIETRKSYVQLVATKGNELPPDAFAPVWLQRVQGGVLTAANLEEAQNDEARIGKRELDALQVLREITTSGTISVAGWGRECSTRGIISGSKDAIEKTIHRVKSALLSAGLITPGIGRGVFVPTEENQ